VHVGFFIYLSREVPEAEIAVEILELSLLGKLCLPYPFMSHTASLGFISNFLWCILDVCFHT
jgi:hypothetical protein